MDNSIQIFSNDQFGQIRTMVDENGTPWFVGKDIAEKLGYSNASKAIIMHVHENDKVSIMMEAHSQNGNLSQTKTSFINESGLYALIMASKLPQAQEFKHWVTSEVLPQIRRTGGYIPLNQEDSDQDILRKAFGILQRTIEQQDAILEAQRPKVLFAEAVEASSDSILIRDLAKLLNQNGIEIGERRLFGWLRANGYLFLHENRPMQRYLEMGLFAIKETPVHTNHGIELKITTKVTGKGQQYFINLFLNQENSTL